MSAAPAWPVTKKLFLSIAKLQAIAVEWRVPKFGQLCLEWERILDHLPCVVCAIFQSCEGQMSRNIERCNASDWSWEDRKQKAKRPVPEEEKWMYYGTSTELFLWWKMFFHCSRFNFKVAQPVSCAGLVWAAVCETWHAHSEGAKHAVSDWRFKCQGDDLGVFPATPCHSE